MKMVRKCKLLKSGAGQSVSLPSEFGFEGVEEVFVMRDDITGDLMISTY